MKKLVVTVMALCLCLALTACTKMNVVTGYKSGDVTLGQYKGLSYTQVSTEVTEEDLQNQIDSFIASHRIKQPVEDRTIVENGDVINLDFAGYLDGVAFDGGTATDYELTVGSNSFIPGFEEALVGFEVGKEGSINVTFPEVYQNNPDLAGKPAVFVCTVKGIFEKIEPEFTDELVAENTDYATIDEFKTATMNSLKQSKESEAEAQMEYDIVTAVVANSTFKKDFTKEIETTKNNLLMNYNSMYSAYYGMDAATVFGIMYGMNAEQFDEYMTEQAETNVKYSYVLSAIAEAEGFEATEEDVSELTAALMTSYGCKTEADLYKQLESTYNSTGKKILRDQVILNKATELLIDSSVAK